jgi:hypothetical protein
MRNSATWKRIQQRNEILKKEKTNNKNNKNVANDKFN